MKPKGRAITGARASCPHVGQAMRAGCPRSGLLRLPCLLLLLSLVAVGGLVPSTAQHAQPKLPQDAEKIGEDLYRVGKLTVDLKAKTATCAGKLNMQRGTVEYLAVAPGGKGHESVLSLELRPLH